MTIKKELKRLRDLAKVLILLTEEVEEAGFFDHESQELLKKVGSSILFMGASICYTQPETK